MKTAQMLALAMLLGSIPVAQIASRFASRTGSKDLAEPKTVGGASLVAVVLLTVVKGFVPTYLAKISIDSYFVVLLAGTIALLSSCFPYWLMFRPSGNGLAVSLGILIGLSPIAGVGVLGVWILAMLLFNRLSVAAMFAGFSAPIWLKVFNAPMAYVWFALLGCIYVILAHSSSLAKLLDGTEPRYR